MSEKIMFKINRPGMGFTVKGESFDENGNRFVSPAGETKIKRPSGFESIVNHWKWPAGINEIVADTSTKDGKTLYNFLINQKARIVKGPKDTRVVGFYVVDLAKAQADKREGIIRSHKVTNAINAICGDIDDAEKNYEVLSMVARTLGIASGFDPNTDPVILWNDIQTTARRDIGFAEEALKTMNTAPGDVLYDLAIRVGALSVENGRVLLRTSLNSEGTDVGIVASVKSKLRSTSKENLEFHASVRAAVNSIQG